MSHSFCLCKISKNRFALTKFVQMQLRCKSGFSPAGHHSHYCLHRVSKNRLLWLVLWLLKTAAKREESFSRMHTRMLQMCGVVAQHSRRLHFSINMRELQIYFIHSHWQLKPRAPNIPFSLRVSLTCFSPKGPSKCFTRLCVSSSFSTSHMC